MASQAHMGHSTSLWNPQNQRYIYGVRQGIHIISLEETAAHLRRAAKVVEGVAYHGGLILFVGTRPGQDKSVVKAAQLAKGCHLFERWIPGTITNRDNILPIDGVKVVNELDEEVDGYTDKLMDRTALKPDLVVCLNPLENYICLQECAAHNIPTIAIIDTDANPTWVTYPIPANDDRCVYSLRSPLYMTDTDEHLVYVVPMSLLVYLEEQERLARRKDWQMQGRAILLGPRTRLLDIPHTSRPRYWLERRHSRRRERGAAAANRLCEFVRIESDKNDVHLDLWMFCS
jgi:ribosomal protein S2